MLVHEGRYHVTLSARQDALAFGFDSEDIRDCVLALNETHFYKYMPAEKVPGLWQDVYKVTYEGIRVYLKLQINFANNAIIISFKEDTS
jgi:hypothetical protein